MQCGGRRGATCISVPGACFRGAERARDRRAVVLVVFGCDGHATHVWTVVEVGQRVC